MKHDEFSIQGLRIFALDDNPMDNRIIVELLKNTGAVVNTETDPDIALERLGRENYDIIFLDHMMLRCDGISVLKQIRDRHLCDETPVAIITANNLVSANRTYLEAGFSAYIPKPVKREYLIDAIRHCLCDKHEEQYETRQNILVVDDDRMNLLIAKKILEAEYSVKCVSSGADAFEYLETCTADLILLDLKMPDMDGFAFLDKIKQMPVLDGIPVICLTADNDHDSEAKCFELGALDFITKPFIAEIVRRRVHRILELNRLQQELQDEVSRRTLQLNQRSRQMERLTVQVMQTLASTIDAKDKYTNGHSVRVAEYSREIARRMNMSDQNQQDIYYIGLLHDIGKIGVPDEIINKTSRLTDEEFAVIKTHPCIGADILTKMSELPDIATGARWHHERYDGRGYPDGLAGDDIPLVARIIGVADSYDAMTSNRSYRQVLPQEVVRGEIEKGKGTQFDPIFAEIMLQIIDEDTEYNLREQK